MKKLTMALLASGSWFVAANANAGGFDGFYIGAKIAENHSWIAGAPDAGVGRGFVGGEAGYNYVRNGLLLGGDVWGDNHRRSVTGRDLGVDFKLGHVDGNALYYIKLGAAGTHPGVRPHFGVGGEYKFSPDWGALAEITYDSTTKNSVTYTNSNYTVGVTYHF